MKRQQAEAVADLAGFLRRENEKLEAGQVRRIIAVSLSFSLPLSRRSETKTDCRAVAGRRRENSAFVIWPAA
jgi:hypothetical protein